MCCQLISRAALDGWATGDSHSEKTNYKSAHLNEINSPRPCRKRRLRCTMATSFEGVNYTYVLNGLTPSFSFLPATHLAVQQGHNVVMVQLSQLLERERKRER